MCMGFDGKRNALNPKILVTERVERVVSRESGRYGN